MGAAYQGLPTDDSLKNAFAPHGQLVEAKVIVDREMGRSKGFGFVTYATIEEAEKAREAMNAKMLDGWVIFVDPAKPKGPRPPPASYSQSQTQRQRLDDKQNSWMVRLSVTTNCIHLSGIQTTIIT
ncbi:unnamed protein product [Rhodiola kirilowii]